MSVKIDQAFTQAFIDGSFGLPIAHEAAPYKPSNGTAYAEIFILPNDITPYSIGSTDETDGIFRVILRYPNGAEDENGISAKTKADEIFAAFPIGSRVTYSGVSATVTSLSRQRGVPENGWYSLVLSISYRSFLARG